MNHLEIKELLIDAKQLIDIPEKWTQGTSARNKWGFPTSTLNEDAVCFCSQGALMKAIDTKYDNQSACIDVYRMAWHHLVDYMENDMTKFNDSSSHGEVMEAWDIAIASINAQTVLECDQ